MIFDVLALGLLLSSAAGVLYVCASAYAVRRFAARTAEPAGRQPPVTILKPLCGDEHDLYENLRSFCNQDYPRFQVVFGVTDPADPAIGVVRRLSAEWPEIDLVTSAEPKVEGANPKVASLENMLRRARHDVLIVADSDIRVGRDYVSSVVGPLEDPTVGIVTCLFAARPGGGIWSRLRAMALNLGFFPAVLFSRMIGLDIGCFGSTMVLRRSCLEKIGGFAAIRGCLADDYALGEAVRRAGLRIVLSRYLVESAIWEPGPRELLHQELRWGRTIRAVAPLGHAGSILCNPVALAALAVLFAPGVATLSMLGAALVVRIGTGRMIERKLGSSRTPGWLVLPRDLLSFYVLVASFFGSTVVWRRRRLQLAGDGRLLSDSPNVGG